MDDARIAVQTGVDGVDVVIGTSSFLREHSHGKDMDYIAKSAVEVIEFVKSHNIEIRFSSEDSFRSDLVDLLSIYRTVDKIGVNRVVSFFSVLYFRILGEIVTHIFLFLFFSGHCRHRWMCVAQTGLRPHPYPAGRCLLRY